jgi:hypothetical protein
MAVPYKPRHATSSQPVHGARMMDSVLLLNSQIRQTSNPVRSSNTATDVTRVLLWLYPKISGSHLDNGYGVRDSKFPFDPDP